MKAAAAARVESRGLRVLIYAADGARRSQFEGFLTQAGYEVAAAREQADIILADRDCPEVDGVPVLALGSLESDHAGSLDYDATAEQIDAALRAVAAGLLVRSPPGLEGGFAAIKDNAKRTLLTPREVEILGAMSLGLTNKMIARRLDISLHTVKFHVESVFRKLGVRTRAEAVARALESQRRETIEL